ncbi:unnamed protein product [Allacma fusca]|uniref:Protein Wnt n=1 Tax=Allacma fusca TaxID=39272 RepID=A0A8J2KPN1_9HEXA|nr:unnamed protein product [Allacma fusca]
MAVAATPPPAEPIPSSNSNFGGTTSHAGSVGASTRPRRSLILVKSNGGPGPGSHSVGSSSFSGSFRMKYQRSVHSTPSRPKRSDLVYLDPSPNYCDTDSTTGSLGTKSRRCFHRKDLNSTGDEQSCDILCCGRGYNTHQIWRRWKCHCKFRWCCEVECQQCQERVEIYTCN